jgi:hypothetical protein
LVAKRRAQIDDETACMRDEGRNSGGGFIALEMLVWTSKSQKKPIVPGEVMSMWKYEMEYENTYSVSCTKA